ncbi:hypothetical protein T492DRAFT_1097213, partial [Pavlovales sp. CCMP2436]
MLMKALEAAAQNGRVDAVIQSTDKNLLVPVGGAIVAAFGRGPGRLSPETVSRTCPGPLPEHTDTAPPIAWLLREPAGPNRFNQR